MISFEVDVALLLFAAFLIGGAAAYGLRLRMERRRLERLAHAALFTIDLTERPRPAPRVAPAPEPVAAPPAPPPAPELPLDLPPTPTVVRRRAAKEAERRPEGTPGTPPPRLDAPEGAPDDLRRIKGIGPQNARRLNELGIYHLRQIAAWTPDEVRWVGAALAFPGRIEREGWVAQAQALVAEDQGTAE